MLTAISLFSGIGAMDLAFSLAGFDILAQVEINDFCQKVLKKHAPQYWRNSIVFTDVHGVGRHNLPSVDCIFGGFPCQPHSVSGKRKGADDHRDLWREFRRIIGEIRPRAVLLENVPNIVNTIGTTVIGDLTALGYDARWGIISAADAGAPHKRDRWWCVGYANSVRYNQPPTVANNHHDCQRRTAPCECTGSAELYAPIAAGESRSAELDNSALNGLETVDQYGGYSGAQTQHTRAADSSQDRRNKADKRDAQSRMGRAAHGTAARLDGFKGFPARPGQQQFDHEPPRTLPDTLSNRHARIEALGNAVVWQCVYPLADGIREALENGG